LLPLVGLFGAAVLVDALHTIIKLGIMEQAIDGARNRNADYVQGALAVVEDGGELFFLMVNAFLSYRIYRFVEATDRKTGVAPLT
jgi:hypothetical protein